MADRGFSPGSGAVWRRASLNSSRSIWPLSSSSKAEKAFNSSALGDKAARDVARELRKTASVMVCGAEGGKNGVTSVCVDGKPGESHGVSLTPWRVGRGRLALTQLVEHVGDILPVHDAITVSIQYLEPLS
jgi:hypothetical protein